jgi:NADPH:quinone reductase-like Zn-dependent oxidoreductase
MRSAGADHVIDFTQQSLTQMDSTYDLILDSAARHSMFKYAAALRPGGTYVMIGGSVGRHEL